MCSAMSSKRSIEMSAAKRRLSDKLVKRLGLDEGVDDGDSGQLFSFPRLRPWTPVDAHPMPGSAPGPIDIDEMCIQFTRKCSLKP